MSVRALIALAALAAVLAGAAWLFAFGGPQRPAAAEAPVAAAADVPPPDPASPLHVEIPGCVCHSADPKVVEEHSRYRMNQCFGCHEEGTPAMGGE